MKAVLYRSLPIVLFIFSLLAVNGLIKLLGSTEDVVHLFPLMCPLRSILGIPCPTCGLGHAVVNAWSFQWATSYAEHPLGIILFICSGSLSFTYLLRPYKTVELLWHVERFISNHPRILLSALVLYVFFGFLRYQLTM